MSIISPETISKIKEKWAHAGFQKYLKNTSWMFIGQFSMIISLAVNIWIARYLGPTNFGTMSYIFAFAGIFAFIANLGISDILIRELVKNPQKKNELLGTAFWILGIGGIIAFLTASTSAIIFESSNLIKILIILYSTIFIWSPVNVISYYFQSTVQAKKNAWAQIFGVIIVTIFKIFLILTGKGIIWLVFSFALDYIVGTLLYVYNYFKSDLHFKDWKFDQSIAKIFLSASMYLTLSAATSYLLLKIDQVMIKFYLTETQVGLYAVAVKLSEIWYFIPGIICASLFPAIINAKSASTEIYTARFKKLYLLLGAIAFLIAAPVAILAPWIIKILYGASYVGSATILQIYVWSGIGFFLGTGINKFLMAENYLKSIFFYNLLAVITNIVLNVILIPRIGLTGAAWSTLISYSIVPIVFFMIKNHNFTPQNKIDSKKISVIVRGLIVGNSELDNKKKFTKLSLESIRKYLPEAQIILSTWKNSDISNLDYDILVLNEEPKRIDMAFENGKTKQMTVNNQLVSSLNGLEKTNREYSLVMRSDIVLTGTDFLKYFQIFNKSKDSDILEKKVVVLPTYNPNKVPGLLFNVCDWFFFGLTTDIKKIFDIPMMDENKLIGDKINGNYLIKNNLESEQYIWTNFLNMYKKINFPNYSYFTQEAIDKSEESYAKHTIMVPANKAQIKCLKMPNAGYGAIPCLSQGLYTFNEYKHLNNKYSTNKVTVITNKIEESIYYLSFKIRQFIQKKAPGLHKKIVNFIRKCNGSYNLLK